MGEKIAVIGSGIAGLVAGWLCREAGKEVTILEASKNRGMDSKTQFLDIGEKVSGFVDIPLRVMSPHAWPTVLKICNKLDVSTFEVDTQIACSWLNSETWFRSSKIRFGSKIFPFAPINYILRIETLRIIVGFIKLYKAKPELLNSEITVKEFAEKYPMDNLFWKGLIYPLLTNICTSDEKTIDLWPANQILVLLQKIIFGATLRRIKGGTKELASKLGNGLNWQYGIRVENLIENSDGIFLISKNKKIGPFDFVICATQANNINFLPEKYIHEINILKEFPYDYGTLWLHKDTRFMPKKRNDWSPIHYQIDKDFSRSMFSVWINPIEPSINNYEPIFQTWNPVFEPKSEKVIVSVPMERAVVNSTNQKLIEKLEELHKVPGRKIFFCGSYASPGVPLLESAARSAIKAVSNIGIDSGLNENYM